MALNIENPVITLLSDLGTKDPSIAIVKSVIMSQYPKATIIDITHSIALNHVRLSAFHLFSSYKFFPVGTIHLVLAGLFFEHPFRIVSAQRDGHFFIAPDNCLLTLAFDSSLGNVHLLHETDKQISVKEWTGFAAKAIPELSLKSNADFALKTVKSILQSQVASNGIDVYIRAVDRYGNLILDINRTTFDQLIGSRSFKISVIGKKNITGVSENYNDVGQYEPLCRFNAAGFLEVAINHGRAATALGLDTLDTHSLIFEKVRIFVG